MSDPSRSQMMSNAHLVHAVMPTIVALVDSFHAGEGVRIGGIEVDGRAASINIDNKIAAGLVKHFLGMVDEACLKMLREAPQMPALAQPERSKTEG